MPESNWTLIGNAGINPSNNFLGTTDNQPILIKTNGTEAIRIGVTGKVGVGTTNPIAKLQVTAPDQVGLQVQGPRMGVGAGISLQTTGPNGRGWEILATGATSAQGVDKLNIRDLGDASDDFTILKGGNVGIGTTDPRTKLQVTAPDQLGFKVQGPRTG